MPFQKKNEWDRRYDGWVYSSKTFWSKVQQLSEDACWHWLGSQGPQGPLFGVYRQQTLADKPKPQMSQARRVMWAEETGSWPPAGMSIFHSCGNHTCLNPRHFALTKPHISVYRAYDERQQKCEQD